VTGRSPIAHPALVWDVAIGQSTVVTHRVKANLFYRGLAFHRYPVLGDTLRTVTVANWVSCATSARSTKATR
jgi:acyl dehydratase